MLLRDGIKTVNKTIKNRMWKMFTVNNNTVYFDRIDKIVKGLNPGVISKG